MWLSCPGAQFLHRSRQQQELIRRLTACKRETGWPVQRLIESLQTNWTLQMDERLKTLSSEGYVIRS